VTNPSDKIRKLMALYNDASTTEGERAGCLAAIERIIKLTIPPEVFAAAAEEAKRGTTEQEFLKRATDRRKRREAGWQTFQERQRHRDFVRETVGGFSRPPTMQQAFQAFDAMW